MQFTDNVGLMLELLAVLIGLFDLASSVLAAVKYWRISCGFLAAASAIVLVCLFSSSPAIRWMIGFQLFVAIVTAGIAWEQQRGELR